MKRIIHRVTKRQRIIEMFYKQQWNHSCPSDSSAGRLSKSFNIDDFEDAGLSGRVENSKDWCDVFYARKIFRELGYKCCLGWRWFESIPAVSLAERVFLKAG